jgi:hypothetical protein
MRGALTTFGLAPAAPSFPRTQQRLIRAAFAELSTDTIEQIAQRVADLLAADRWNPTPRLLDAGELARRYGLTRAWVYQHADLLGAIRTGTGPRARLRFDPNQVAAVLSRGTGPGREGVVRNSGAPARPRTRPPTRPEPSTPLLRVHQPGRRGTMPSSPSS